MPAASGGGCTCTGTIQHAGSLGLLSVDPQTAGGYTTSGNTLTTDSVPEAKYSYCVSGDMLTLTPQSANPMQSGTVVLTKSTTSGAAGTSGTAGTTGAAGTTGTAGSGGTTGAAGRGGTTGTAGTTAAGTTGDAGRGGTTGVAGGGGPRRQHRRGGLDRRRGSRRGSTRPRRRAL